MPRATRQPSPEKAAVMAASRPTEERPPNVSGPRAEPPPTRAEFERLAAQVRRLAAQIAHGRA